MRVNETVERAKFEAKKAKKFVKKNKDTIIFWLKIAALFGGGFYCGGKVTSLIDGKVFKKYLPTLIARGGMAGVDTAFNWIAQNVPAADESIDKYLIQHSQEYLDFLPLFLEDPTMKECFKAMDVNFDKFCKQYRSEMK